MTAPKLFTWDYDVASSTPARAASLDDLGSAQLKDHAKEPPVPPEQPYADQLNQWALQLAGVNRVIESLILDIHFAAGTPTIIGAAAMSSLITTTWAIANITVVHTATGIITITLLASYVPPQRAKPNAWVTTDGAYLQPIAVQTGNIIVVKTRNAASALVDVDFSLALR